MPLVDLVCLGVGKGASYVMKGIPSTSFSICVDGVPFLLVDAGAGIALSCLRHLDGVIPSNIFITHNHMDHTGDLPIMLAALVHSQNRPKVFGHADVLNLVKEHRMHDPAVNVDDLAEWVTPNPQGIIDIGKGFFIHPLKTKHSYLCYGFILHYNHTPILGYSADSPFDVELYEHLAVASIVLIDARDKATYDHPSFDEVEQFAKSVKDCSIWIVHYEQTHFVPNEPNMSLLAEGQIIRLMI